MRAMVLSPRKKFRSRVSQPVALSRYNTDSSASSVSSGRVDRQVRSHLKAVLQQSSVAALSNPPEKPESIDKPDKWGARSNQGKLRREAMDAKKDPTIDHDSDNGSEDNEVDEKKEDQNNGEAGRVEEGQEEDDEEEDEEDEEGEEEDENDEDEEEITRCVCGNQEYPGLPDLDIHHRNNMTADLEPPTHIEDSTGWFIQCDKCKVWQHGGCVGIIDENTSPEEYFCEQCRRDLHQCSVTPTGRKYTLYLPIQGREAGVSSLSLRAKSDTRKTRESRIGRADTVNLVNGRRATMNSRDSAYDELAQLQRAIEESKKDTGPANTKAPLQGKRNRSESEDRMLDAKRQRTNSNSSSSKSKAQRPIGGSDQEAEEEEAIGSIRGAATRNQTGRTGLQHSTASGPERTASTGKREGRGERRKANDLETSREFPPITASAKTGAPTDNSSVLPLPIENSGPKASHLKKSGRPPARRGRLGRNQLIKERELPAIDASNSSPVQSHHSADGDNTISSNVNGIQDSNSAGRPSKPRYMNPNRTTMNDMRKRVAGILEFISHTQVEMANTEVPLEEVDQRDGRHRSAAHSEAGGTKDVKTLDDVGFEGLSSLQMMELLTRSLMRWQGQYGRHGDK